MLNLGLVAALVAVGITAHSLAVLAEGSDYLLDAAGVAVALLAIRLSARPANPARPGPTDIAALVNCGWLLVLEVLVAAAAAARLITGTPPVQGLPVLIVSGVAALTMTAAALVLRADDDDADGRNLSVAAVLLDMSPTPLPRQASPPRAGSSWPPEAGTGSTPRWRSSSPWSSPTTPTTCTG